MRITKQAVVVLACTAAVGLGGADFVPRCVAQAAQSQSATSRMLGTVKAVSATGLSLTSDSGVEITVTVAEGARMLKTAPGQRDLTGATPIQLTDVQVGDRLLVRGSASADGKSLAASTLIVMKKSDIAEKQAREMADWQKRGISGRVTALDPAAGTVTVSAGSLGASHSVAVRASKNTIVRRYAPDSVKFDDASAAPLDQIKVGDQLRARGERNPEGTELAAEEIVAGTFHNIGGTVVSVDAAESTVTVKDAATKKPVVVKITADSQMRKLPPTVAQMLAAAAKRGGQAGGGNAAPAQGGRAARQNQGSPAGPNGSRGDMGQMLNRLPAVKLTELLKDDAVMVVATQGTGAHVTAVTLLSGVEPILTASPNDGVMMLSNWSLDMGGGEGGGGAQ